jgi:hypothetical protein
VTGTHRGWTEHAVQTADGTITTTSSRDLAYQVAHTIGGTAITRRVEHRAEHNGGNGLYWHSAWQTLPLHGARPIRATQRRPRWVAGQAVAS